MWSFLLLFWSRHLYLVSLSQNLQDTCFRFFLIQHIVNWVLQIIGHAVFEKRAPALTDNLLLTLNAPFFVTAEVLKIMGWKKEEFVGINKEVNERIERFRESKKAK